jgi:hypothetical protein
MRFEVTISKTETETVSLHSTDQHTGNLLDARTLQRRTTTKCSASAPATSSKCFPCAKTGFLNQFRGGTLLWLFERSSISSAAAIFLHRMGLRPVLRSARTASIVDANRGAATKRCGNAEGKIVLIFSGDDEQDPGAGITDHISDSAVGRPPSDGKSRVNRSGVNQFVPQKTVADGPATEEAEGILALHLDRVVSTALGCHKVFSARRDEVDAADARGAMEAIVDKAASKHFDRVRHEGHPEMTTHDTDIFHQDASVRGFVRQKESAVEKSLDRPVAHRHLAGLPACCKCDAIGNVRVVGRQRGSKGVAAEINRDSGGRHGDGIP